jgi:xanthine dehydrogenase accessory factor
MTVVPISCQSEGALEVYIEPIVPAPRLVIVGRSPMTQALAGMAGSLGWNVSVVAGEEFSAADADERSMVVVATQGHGDEEVIEQAVAAQPAYLGLVGSRRRGAAILGYLCERGIPERQLDRVRVPAGLDLGRITHQEIAVAILAELVQLRASGTLTPGPPAAVAARPPAQAVDPMCGMTVTAGPAGHPAAHGGETYYFCSTRCRREFVKDPAAYTKKESRCLSRTSST